MRKVPKITSFEMHMVECQVSHTGLSPARVSKKADAVFTQEMFALKVNTDIGVSGEYVSPYVVEAAMLPQALPLLIGYNALERENIYNQAKRHLKKALRTGLAAVDIVLWDLAGKYYNAPIYELLGGYRKRIPVYLSTTSGGKNGALKTPEEYADFAEQALQLGYRGFKIHPWSSAAAPVDQHVAMIHAVGRRVGGKMDLMLDGSLQYETFADTLKVARACDEENFFWLEDPMNDGGMSHYAAQKLRQLIKTPLLQGEYAHGVEQRMTYLTAEATDFIRGDVIQDGITATMKLAHAAEALGVDIEIHVGGPETRHCIAAIRNTNYYEWGLLNPKIKRVSNPSAQCKEVHKEGHLDVTLDGIGKDGCVPVPEGPGLGVVYDWDFIKAHRTAVKVFK